MSRTLIKSGTIVPMDGKSRIIRGKALLIEGDRIAAIGDAAALAASTVIDRVIDATDKAVLPGIVNAHTHVGPTGLFRGVTEDMSAPQFMALVSPILEEIVTPEDFYAGARLGCLEVLKAGATCVNELGYDMDATARAIRDVGLRGVLGPDIGDIVNFSQYVQGEPRFDPDVGRASVAKAMEVFKEWQGAANGRITCRFANYSALTCSPDFLKETRALATEQGVGINVHVLTSTWSAERGRQFFGKDTIEFLHDIGYLGPVVALVHLLIPTADELSLIAKSGTWLVHCPLIYAKAGDYAPMGAIYGAGIGVALGTDAMVMDPWEQMRCAMVLARVVTRSVPVITSYDVLEMSTIKAARAIGMGADIGSLEVGKKADIILVDLDQAHLAPLTEHHDLIKTLVHNATGRDVETVLIDGEIVVADRRATRIDEREVVREAAGHARRVMARAETAA